MEKQEEQGGLDSKRLERVAVIGGLVSVFVFVGLGLLGRAATGSTAPTTTSSSSPAASVSGARLVIRSP